MKTSFSLTLLLAAIVAAKAGQAIITTGPQDLTINAGSTADFIVTASGATSYQWVFQGTNITGATNKELNFSDVSTNQAGAYSVIVYFSGTNLTNSANLTVLQGTIVEFQISGFATGPSNVLVELFDHDKPATVQNFLHYIISDNYTFSNAFVPGDDTHTYSTGIYSNMFFDRLIPGFVLQGGGWAAGNRTTNILYANSIANIYTGLNFKPPFPQELASEFYAGPKVSNRQGTMAMALPPGNVNGASSAFFFNLVDNPFLDVYTNGGGPFTVFGRVLSGSEVLAYFNNTNAFFKRSFSGTPTHNIFTNGIFDFQLLNPTDTTELTDLPVNYHRTNYPANSNLFFVDFSFPAANAQPVIDATPPTAAITVPPADVVLTNGISLTAQGTAQDDFGLAQVQFTLLPLNGATSGTSGFAIGTTNWSYPEGVLQPGVYNLVLTSQDGAGNLSSEIQQPMIITAVLTNGDGVVAATNVINRSYTANAFGANLRANTNYAFGAQPAPGWVFVNWRYGTNTSFTPNLTLKFGTNMVLTANFVSNSVVNGMAFSYPPVGGNTTNGNFSIAGVISSGLLTPPVTVTCRLFSQTNQQLVGSVRQLKATNTWAFPVTNLALGEYYAV
ncbi:MAG: peptidylprolyl isomerase, partial [Verrucomicrobiota bacterium]